MYSNKPITPEMADAAAGLADAVLAIMADPQAAKQAVEVRAAALKLTEAQRDDYEKALKTLADAAGVEQKQRLWDASLRGWEAKLKEKQDVLDAACRQHTENVDGFNRSQQAHNKKLAVLEAREAELEDGEEALALDRQRVTAAEAQVKKREDVVLAREKAVAALAKNIGG